MAINFPNSPANGDTHVSGEKTFNYDAAKGVWNLEGNLKVALDITSTPPSSPSHGDLWMDEATGDMYTYFTDTDSSQWIQINGVGAVGAGGGSGGVTVYANFAAFPSSGNTEGDFAFATDTKAVYIWDGSEWDRISSGPQIGPRYTTTPPSQSNLSTSGATSTLTAVAVDESGFPITYDWDAYSGSTVYNSSNLPPQLTAVSENNGVFTLTPSTSESDSGEVIFRTKASDGVLFTPAITNLALIFGLENITGFVVDQTSIGNYNHTVWHAAMFNSGGSVFNDSSLRSSTTAVGYTPTSNVPEWGQGFTSNTHTVNYGPALMLSNATAAGFTVPDPFYTFFVSEGTANDNFRVEWTSGGVTGQRFYITGWDAANGNTYFNGGQVKFYINGVLESNWRSLTTIGSGNSTAFYIDLMV
jgi:hypothetical protein